MPGDPSIVVVSEDRVSVVAVQQPVQQTVQVVALGPQGPAGAAGNLDGLTDVTITGPTSGQALVFNGSQWVNQAVSAVGSLDDLSDVTITTPSSAQVLRFNGAAWVNGSVAYSELTGIPSTFPPSAHTHTASQVTDFSSAADARIAAANLDALANVTVPSPSTNHVLKWNGSAWVSAFVAYSELTGAPTFVTSVGLSMPSIFSVSGSPVTSSGTLSVSLVSQSAARVLASPTSSAGVPSFRELVVADIGNFGAGVESIISSKACYYGTTAGPLSFGNAFYADGNLAFKAEGNGMQKMIFCVLSTGTLNPGVIVGVDAGNFSADFAWLRVGSRIIDVINTGNELAVPMPVTENGAFALEVELIYINGTGAPIFYIVNNDTTAAHDITILEPTNNRLVMNNGLSY